MKSWFASCDSDGLRPPRPWSLTMMMGHLGGLVCDTHAAKVAEPWPGSPTFRPCSRGAFLYVPRASAAFPPTPPSPTSFPKSRANLTKELRTMSPALGVRLVVLGGVSCLHLQSAAFPSSPTELAPLRSIPGESGRSVFKKGPWRLLPSCFQRR